MGQYDKLPDPVRLEETVAESDARDVPDPECGRDTDRDWLIRYGFGGPF
ncbi:MAG: heme biosynthesis protein HemY [Actinomycetia bacterium]|nr:heme biosynthesis protein HemY [Actinomycetes bacterium]